MSDILERRARSGAVAATLSACYALAFVDRALVGVTGPLLQRDLRIGDVGFGILSGPAFAILFCLCGVPMGFLADRWSRKRLIQMGLIVWTAMTVLCAVAPSVTVFALGRVGVGLGEACLVPAGASWLAAVTAPEKLGRAIAIFLLGATAGNILAFLGGGLLLSLLEESAAWLHIVAPWRLAFLLACLPAPLVMFLLWRLDEPPAGSHQDFHWGDSLAYIMARWSGFAFVTLATGCNIVLTQAQLAWLPIFFLRRFGVMSGQGALLAGFLFLLSAPLGQALGGMAMDGLRRAGFGAPPLTLMGGCAALALVPLLVFCLHPALWVSALGYVLFNICASAATPAGMTAWQALTPPHLRGAVTALLVAVVTFIGVGFGPPAIGLLTALLPPGAAALAHAMALLFSGAVVAIVALSIVGQRFYRGAIKAIP